MIQTRLAMIGCGAVARISHLPAIQDSGDCALAALVDENVGRARQLALHYGVTRAVQDYREVAGEIDAAIVALPNHLHAPVAVDLLSRGVHTLVEKPMALTTTECDRMLDAARDSGAVLAIGLEYRFFDSSRLVKDILDSRLLGDIESFDLRQGVISQWPFASDYIYRKELAGGGVLVDFGSHMLDLLLCWFGDVDAVDYADNAMGGTEADAEVRLRFRSGVCGIAEMSRARALRNSCIIRGEKATLEAGIWDSDAAVRLHLPGSELALTGHARNSRPAELSFRDVYRRQLAEFTAAIRESREPLVSGWEGRRGVELIERCYECRRSLPEPWWSAQTDSLEVLS